MPAERAYPDIISSFYAGLDDERARGARAKAKTYAQSGDYEEAGRALIDTDPERAQNYLTYGERQAQREYGRTYADALSRNDYSAAERAAVGRGDVAGVTSARGAQQQYDVQQRTQAWRRVQSVVDSLSGVSDEAGWRSVWDGVLNSFQGQQIPPQIERIARAPYSPQAAQAARTLAQTMQRNLLSPQELAEIEADQRKFDIQERNADTAERRAAAAETTAQAALARAGNADRSQGAAGLRPDQVRLEREFARDWRGVRENFSDIQQQMDRIETVGNLQNAAGDLALVVSFTKMLDPGSVAREGEVALTQSAASALARAQTFVPRLERGNTLLPNSVRSELLNAAREMYQVYERSYQNLAQDYEATATEYGFEPSRVMMGYRPAGTGDAPPARPPSVPADAQWNPQTRRWEQ